MPKGNWHQSRTSNRQKMAREREYEKLFGEKKKRKLIPIDITKSDWSKSNQK